MNGELIFIGFIVAIALVFDFANGFHDAANSIATVVSTRVLSPMVAVIWAAFFNFVAAFVFGVHVANTIGKGVIDTKVVDERLILSALIGAIIWDVITWYYGMPSSSSHALIGGLVGAAFVAGGLDAIIGSGLRTVGAFIILSPIIGFVLAALVMFAVRWLHHAGSPSLLNPVFRRLQLVSAAAYSLSHGTNDAQKTMGVIAVLLFTTGHLSHFTVPIWVILSAHTAIAAGTLAGGWRIVRTMGTRITALQPVGGFCAESAAASSIIYASRVGVPVSTTHTIAGAIMGVGATRRLSAVRWGVAMEMIWAWVLTIPAAALMSAVVFLMLKPL